MPATCRASLSVRVTTERLCRGFARKMVQLPRAVVVNDNGHPLAARRLDLKLAPDAGKIRFTDGRHNSLSPYKRLIPFSLNLRLQNLQV